MSITDSLRGVVGMVIELHKDAGLISIWGNDVTRSAIYGNIT